MKRSPRGSAVEAASLLDGQRRSPIVGGPHHTVPQLVDAHLPRQPKNADTLLEWKDLMEWQRDNEFVLTGYRQPSYSLSLSAKSILKLHNESVNIWSHLVGASVFFAFLPFSYLHIVPRYSSATGADALALAIFFSGVTICFVLSTIFHTCTNHSKEGHRIGNQLDHLGIVIVIWGSAIPSDYFGFYCDQRLQYFYWTMATTAAIASGIFTMRPVFRTPTYRPFRSAMYGVLGLSIFVPAIHGVMLNGWTVQNERMSLLYFMGLGILNGTGTAIYTARIPERWYPRRFDIYGSSHQIMHVLVICGAFSHTIGLVKAFDYWQGLLAREGGACPHA